jgi:hypothetical protein
MPRELRDTKNAVRELFKSIEHGIYPDDKVYRDDKI